MRTLDKLTLGKVKPWLGNFDLRVGLAMSADASRTLFGESDAQNLPHLRAYFQDESTTNGLEKFKPYAVPLIEEIKEYSSKLKQRQT